MLDFLPAFDSPTAEHMESTAQENATRAAVYRRLALALLTKTSTKLRQAVAEAPGAFLSNTEGLRGAIEWDEAQAAGVISDKCEIPIRLGAVIDQEAPHG